MRFTSRLGALEILLSLLSLTTRATAQWQLSYLLTEEVTASDDPSHYNTSLGFTLNRGSVLTNCSVDWVQYPAPDIPTAWNKCDDPWLRFRVEAFYGASNLTLEVVEVDQTPGSTTVNVTRTTVSIQPGSTIPLALTTTTAAFTPSPFDIYYALARNDGANSGVTPCTEAWTFYITNPNVATLGPLTLGRGTETQWETICTSNWDCGAIDPSITAWASCNAPAFAFEKTLPPSGGDQTSNFLLTVQHSFPLLVATAIRSADAPDYGLKDPEEAGGLEVVLTLATMAWKNGGLLTPLEEGGVDQTGNCSVGCEFGNTRAETWVPVVSVRVI